MRDPYLYPDSDVLKNLAGIQDLEELKNMEADYTLLRLSSGIFDTEERIRQVIAEDESPTQFDFQTLCGLHYRIFQDDLVEQKRKAEAFAGRDQRDGKFV